MTAVLRSPVPSSLSCFFHSGHNQAFQSSRETNRAEKCQLSEESAYRTTQRIYSHQNVINIQISIFESFKIASLTLWNTITQAESVCSTGSSSSKYGSDAAVGLQASHPVKSHKLIRSAESSCCKLLVDTCHGKRSMLDQGRMSP